MGLHLAININDLRICIQTRDTKKQVNIKNGVCKQTMIISTQTDSLKHSIQIQYTENQQLYWKHQILYVVCCLYVVKFSMETYTN